MAPLIDTQRDLLKPIKSYQYLSKHKSERLNFCYNSSFFVIVVVVVLVCYWFHKNYLINLGCLILFVFNVVVRVK